MHARTTARPLALLSALLLFATVGLSACGDDGSTDAGTGDTTTTKPSGDDDRYGGSSDDGTTLPGGAGEGTDDEVTVVAKDFSLTSVSAAPGTDVSFSNEGAKTHTLTADDGAFDTGNVEAGDDAVFVAPSEPGSYPFHCSIHASMTGTLTVEG